MGEPGGYQRSRSLRELLKAIDVVVPVLGIVVVLGAVLFVIQLRLQIVLVVAGLLMVEVGVWKLAIRLMPDERKFTALRTEVDRFVDLVRELNRAALEERGTPSVEARQEFEDIVARLHETTDRIAAVAGKTRNELQLEAQPWP
jgi:hypothetical protein